MRSLVLVLVLALAGCTARHQKIAGLTTAGVGAAVVGGAGIAVATDQAQEPFEVVGAGLALVVVGLIVFATAD